MERSNNFVLSIFGSVFELFDRVYSEFDAWGLVIGAVTVYTIYRFLLKPIVGGSLASGSSDKAKKNREED